MTASIRLNLLTAFTLMTWMGMQLAHAASTDLISVYSSIAPDNQTIVRAVSQSVICPSITIDGKTTPMQKRVGPADGTLAQEKPAIFPESVCEWRLSNTAQSIEVEGQVLPKRTLIPQKIVLIGDTGCRMKAPNEFQACENESDWPLAKVAMSATAEKPDLVIHVGDYHYRENACQTPGCEHSPYGYGFDTWNADFFTPLSPLLKAAPWVFVRGNHESCARAGQGWFRYLDLGSFTPDRSCATKNSSESEFTDPYAIPLGDDQQLIVFDSSGAIEKKSPETERLIKSYQTQLKQVAELAKHAPHNWLILHHPTLGYSYSPQDGFFKANTSVTQSLAQKPYKNFFPDNIQPILQGHFHTFELTSFEKSTPLSLITGFGGSTLDSLFINAPPRHYELSDDVKVAETLSSQNFGYSTLEKTGDHWTLKQKDINGQTKLTCQLSLDTVPEKFSCQP